MLARVLTLLCGVCVAGAAAFADEPTKGDPITLRYVWQPGTTTYHRMTMSVETKIKSGETDLLIRQHTTMLERSEVYSVRDDGTGRIAMTMTRIRAESEDPFQGKTVFDSASPTDDKPLAMSSVFGALVGKTLIMEITPEHRVLHVQGGDEVADAAAARLSSKDPAAADRMRQLTNRFLQGLGGSADALPSQSHRVGEEWTEERSEVDVPMGGDASVSMKSKIESVEVVSGHRIATLSMRGEVHVKMAPKDGGSPNAPGPSIGGAMTLKMQGLKLFDLDRGRLVRMEMRSTGGSLDSPGADGSKPGAGSMEMKMMQMVELVGPEDPIDPQTSENHGK